MRRILLGLIVLVGMLGMGADKKPAYRTVWVRVSHYSPHERYEPDINHRGKCILNDRGIACNVFPDGTRIEIPGVEGIRVVDDRLPRRTLKRRGTNYFIDIRWAAGLKGKKHYQVRRVLRKKKPGNPKKWIPIRVYNK